MNRLNPRATREDIERNWRALAGRPSPCLRSLCPAGTAKVHPTVAG
ncbi:hypothetical protein ACFFX0_31845 [Citricoccus parietis]|uniref:Uncharacterized protein n=1 Tax=Citricoccus parietis TaxID=592307 RepID=A0ABV5G971_9MICC